MHPLLSVKTTSLLGLDLWAARISRREALLSGLALPGWAGVAEPLPVRLDEALWLDVLRTRGIQVGSKGEAPPVYVFFDPNCPYCKKLWLTRLPADLGGSMSKHPAVWVPVAYLKPTSFGRAVAILRRGNVQALELNFESGFDEDLEEGALPPLEPMLSERMTLELNLRIWKGIAQVSPLMVWRMRSAQRPARWMGLPSPQKLEAFLRDVAV